MQLYYGSIVLVVLSNILYHLSQKAMPAGANPMALLLVTYLTAAAVALGALVWTAEGSLTAAFSGVNWLSLLLGVSLVGLELGFLLAYRAGWDVSVCAMAVNTAVAVALLPIGALLFKEGLSLGKALGAALCIAGLLLIHKG